MTRFASVRQSLNGVATEEVQDEVVQIQMKLRYDRPIEYVQYGLNVAAAICNCCIHLYIVIRLIVNYDKLSHYRNFVVAQSSVYIIGSVIMFLTNYVYCDGILTYGQPFLPLSPHFVGIMMCAMEVVSQLETTLLAIFNIYRTAVIVRSNHAMFFYIIVVVIAIISYATTLISGLTQNVALRYVALAFTSSGFLPTIVCYFIIRQHFKVIKSSDIVKRMQSKLSLGLLLQWILQMISTIIMWSGFAFNCYFIFSFDNAKAVEAVVDVYFVIADIFMAWIPAITGLLIKWSISGFLQGKTAPAKSSSGEAYPERRKSVLVSMYTERKNSILVPANTSKKVEN
ncbi:hypothetical protein Aduo_007074 [Ancylostoma duodenale]